MNKVILIGNLTGDPVKSTTPTGVDVCKFSLAVSRKFSKDGATDFFNITCWRNLADICANNLAKGRKVCVTGSIQLRQYQSKEGDNRTAVDIIAEDVEFLSARNSNSADQDASSSSNHAAPAGLQEEPTTSDAGLPF